MLIKLRAIAINTLQETLRKRVLYFVALLLVLILAGIFSQLKIMEMAREAGETKTVSDMSTHFVSMALGTWNFIACALALFLGAVGISSEVTAKTIVNVLSRPVGRSTYLIGRWVGILVFIWFFQLLGIGFALTISHIFEVHFTSLFWVGCIEMLVRSALFSGLSLDLSVWMTPVLAGALAFFSSFLPNLVDSSLHHPIWILRMLANLVYYLLPADMPANLLSDSFKMQLLHPDYALYFQVLGENLFYAVIVFMIACLFFDRRELRLR